MMKSTKLSNLLRAGQLKRKDIGSANKGHVRELLHLAESKTIEFETASVTPNMLARVIASFANTEGGTIVVGVDEHQNVLGINSPSFEQLYREAIELLSPRPAIKFSLATLDEKTVAIIYVEKSEGPVISDYGFYLRKGSKTIAMSAEQLANRIQHSSGSELTILTELIEKQTLMIEDLKLISQRKTGWREKWTDYLIGGLVGAVLGYLMTLLG